jgi:predicted O-methyltransferase YrrM
MQLVVWQLVCLSNECQKWGIMASREGRMDNPHAKQLKQRAQTQQQGRGVKDNMPFIGPKKGALLQSLVRQRAPNLAVEVGSMAGYSALTIAGALPKGARLIGMESDLLWALTAKRFVWQAAQGEQRSQVNPLPPTPSFQGIGRTVTWCW